MTNTAVAFLGAIAVAVVIMALLQVGAAIFAYRLARRVDGLVHRVEHGLQPAVDRLTVMTSEAARAAKLAAGQIERVDRMVDNVATRVDDTVATVQRSVVKPVREGAALVAALRAGVDAIREVRRRRRSSSYALDEDDPLFIG